MAQLGSDWGGHTVVYNHNTYISHSNTFYNRNNYYRNGGERGVTNNVNRGCGERAAEWNTMTVSMAKTMPINAGTLVNAAQSRIAPESGPSTVIAARREGSGRARRKAAGPLASADTTTAETPGAFLRAGSPVSAAVRRRGDSTAAVAAADIIASRFRMRIRQLLFSAIYNHSEIQNGEKTYASIKLNLRNVPGRKFP